MKKNTKKYLFLFIAIVIIGVLTQAKQLGLDTGGRASLISDVLAFSTGNAIIVTILGVLYIISPIDLIPDFVPIAGWVDDAMVAFLIVSAWGLAIASPLMIGLFIVIGLFMLMKMMGGMAGGMKPKQPWE